MLTYTHLLGQLLLELALRHEVLVHGCEVALLQVLLRRRHTELESGHPPEAGRPADWQRSCELQTALRIQTPWMPTSHALAGA